MQNSQSSDSPGALPTAPLDETQKKAIQRELNRILESTPFRTSKRSQQCLGFIVRTTLEGRLELLKERCIGAEVFGRAPDYDTNADAVVRISANDLRKRLAQYHEIAVMNNEVRIDLPAGSYHPEFHWPDAHKPDAGSAPAETSIKEEIPTPERRTRFRWEPKWQVLAGIGLAILTAGVLWSSLHPPKTAVELFWAPVLQSPKPVLIAPGQPVVYLLSRRIHDEYCAGNPNEKESGPHVVNLGSASVPPNDIVPVSDQFVGSGDAVTMLRLTELFGKLGKPVLVRIGEEASFADLRNSPTVLIGAFSNRWNLELGRELRFSFEVRDHVKMITDRVNPGRAWRTELDPSGHTRLDYALVSRIYDSSTGQLIVQAAGAAKYGTQAAGDFLTDKRYWEPVLREAPKAWATKNLQIVIRVKVIANAPGSPEVVAIHSW